ncbi:MAG: hypothetical protein ACMUEL_06505 [Flavobacteriales bacterium Tduv]
MFSLFGVENKKSGYRLRITVKLSFSELYIECSTRRSDPFKR